MVRFGQDKIEEVRARADIVEIVGAQVRLKRAGRNFIGLCPFHNEKTPSFTVNGERGFFHCFGCGAGGTVFDFVMRTEAMNFAEALHSLAGRYGITLPEREEHGGGSAAGEREAMARANQTAAEFYGHVLWNTPDGTLARDYLKARGIVTETARHFMLGFAPARPANLAANLNKRGLTEAAVKLGLVRKDTGGACYDMFRARLMFPIRDAQGRVIAFGGRVLDQRLPKYINSPESPLYSKARALYGIHEARKVISRADSAIVVEGYIDAIALWQAGFKETVASLGTALTVEQLRLLSRYTRNIAACFDGDAAGRKASLRALEVFLSAGLLGKSIFIPPGFDPDTLVRERGAEAMREMVASAELLVDYFMREQAATAHESLSAQARAGERVAEILRMVTNPFEFDLLARKAASTLEISEELLRAQARRGPVPAARVRAPEAAAPPRAAKGNAATQGEIGLVAIALRYPELRAKIIEQTPPGDFDDHALRALFDQVCHSEEAGGSLEVAVLERLGEAEHERLSALMVGPMIDDAAKAEALGIDYANAIARRNRGREVETLRRAAVAAGADGAAAAAQAVIALRRQMRGH
ncbi:MAG: DNA primase [Candidatus Binataceae bacterium]